MLLAPEAIHHFVRVEDVYLEQCPHRRAVCQERLTPAFLHHAHHRPHQPIEALQHIHYTSHNAYTITHDRQVLHHGRQRFQQHVLVRVIRRYRESCHGFEQQCCVLTMTVQNSHFDGALHNLQESELHIATISLRRMVSHLR